MKKIDYIKNQILNFIHSNKTSEAFALINKVLKENNDNLDYYLLIGELLAKTNFIYESIDYLKKAAELSPENFEIYKSIGSNYMLISEYYLSLDYFSQAEKFMKKFDSELIYNMGQCLMALGDLKLAETYFKKILIKDKKEHIPYIGFGKISKLQGRFNEAKKHFKKALKIENDSIYALENYGELLIDTGELEEARNVFCRILQLNSDNAIALHQLGVIEYENNRFDDALSYYKRAIELKPDMFETYGEIGWIYHLQGNITESMKYLEKSLELNPDNSKTEIDYGAVCFAGGFIKKAATIWKKILKKEPDNILVMNYLKKVDEYKKNYDQQMWFDEKEKGGFCICGSGKRIRDCCLKEIDLTQHLINLNDYKKSILKKNRVQGSREKKIKRYLLTGKEYLNNGLYQNAIQEFLKVKDIDKKNIIAYQLLSKCYYFTGEISKAFYILEAALEVDENNAKTHILIGDLYNKIYFFETAIKKYHFVMNKFSNQLTDNELSDLHNNLGAIFFQKNEYKKAGIEWKKALSLNKKNERAIKNLELLKKI